MIYPHTITLLKANTTESINGGISRTHEASGISYPAFVQPQRESLAVINDTGGRDSVVNVYLQPTTPISATDRFVFSNTTYEVTGAISQYGISTPHHIKATARILGLSD